MEKSVDFKIERMSPLRIARVALTSENPEVKAFSALIEWAKEQNITLGDNIRFFGFNDPCPEPGQKVYEYEAWMTVDDAVSESGDITIFNHPGGDYAVVTTPLTVIGDAWHGLGKAVKEKGYRYGSGPALEEILTHPTETPFEAARIKLHFPVKK